MTAPAVIDTNVLVAGLISGSAQSPTVQILDGMLAARFIFVLSSALLAEYQAVLQRPGLQKLHGLSASDIDELLTQLTQAAVWREGQRTGLAAPDPGDQFLWDLLAAHEDLHLVSGDKQLLAAPSMQTRVISPQAFVATW